MERGQLEHAVAVVGDDRPRRGVCQLLAQLGHALAQLGLVFLSWRRRSALVTGTGSRAGRS